MLCLENIDYWSKNYFTKHPFLEMTQSNVYNNL